ncbi:type II secretion system protein GspH [Parahaliea maris]|uniref:Type II secretion system protein H n=1 Tax=Parahaliea maris TaxID=2716870 RepID=A0A5C8ZS57_9GAMM|nr:GspH/FimT family pseudopilin [Parahaliea maris]TXS91215.1 type II secretion system protein GspH [Parahaliea maris]
MKYRCEWRTSAPPVCSRGFTLLELVLVMAILVMVMSIVSVRLVSSEAGDLRTESQKLASQLRYLRARALADGRIYDLSIAADGRAYRLDPNQPLVELPDAVQMTLNPSRHGQVNTPGTVSFYPDGSSSGARISLAGATAEVHLDVSWITGEVSIEKGD